MSLGAYDEDEHTRREMKNNSVDAGFDDTREEYRGEIEYDEGESAEALLDQFKQLQEE